MQDPGATAGPYGVAGRVPARATQLSARLLHALLLLATFITTTSFGSAVSEAFAANHALSGELLVRGYARILHPDRDYWSGLTFSLPLLAILLAHEWGHYLECRRRGVDASLPYFLPSPLLLGTFGAFIRIRSPIYSRESLFDIGWKGPLAGFVTILPFLAGGIALSKVTAMPPGPDSILMGAPLALRLAEQIRFPGAASAQIVLHPMAMAAWAGLFATALNLLPAGQLDGGHIAYAAGGPVWHRRISLLTTLLLVAAGFVYWPWWIWAVVLFFLGRRHPLIFDSTPLSRDRLKMAAGALAILLLSLSIVPIRGL